METFWMIFHASVKPLTFLFFTYCISDSNQHPLKAVKMSLFLPMRRPAAQSPSCFEHGVKKHKANGANLVMHWDSKCHESIWQWRYCIYLDSAGIVRAVPLPLVTVRERPICTHQATECKRRRWSCCPWDEMKPLGVRGRQGLVRG